MKRLKVLLATTLLAASTSAAFAQQTPPQPAPRTDAPARTDTTRANDSGNWGWIGLLGLAGLAGLLRTRRRDEVITDRSYPAGTMRDAQAQAESERQRQMR